MMILSKRCTMWKDQVNKFTDTFLGIIEEPIH